MGDDFWFGRVGLESVGGENGAVILRVSDAKVGWHRQRIVEIGERRVGIFAADIKNRLCRLGYFLAQRR